jgi:uncharacterized protein YukE
MDLTGTVTNLSGRVNSLENQNSYVTQQLLQRPGLKEFSEYQVVWNRQLNDLSTIVTRIDSQIKVLQQLYINLNMTVTSNYATFTGHTGLPGLHNVI